LSGPEKVEAPILILTCECVGAHLSACRQPGLSDVPVTPELVLNITQLHKKKKGSEDPFFRPGNSQPFLFSRQANQRYREDR